MSTRYLKTFFEEKQLPEVTWSLEVDGFIHIMSNETVIAQILVAPPEEQRGIANMIRKIDFVNGDVNDYLKHLGTALAKRTNENLIGQAEELGDQLTQLTED